MLDVKFKPKFLTPININPGTKECLQMRKFLTKKLKETAAHPDKIRLINLERRIGLLELQINGLPKSFKIP